MASSSNSRGWKFIALVILAHVLLLAIFVGEEWVQRSLAKERGMNRTFYTEPAARAAEERGAEWFTAAFVDTGIMEIAMAATMPTEADNRRSQGTVNLGAPVFDWWEGRLRTWWTLVFAAFLRTAHLLLWWPYAIFFIAPFLIDGLVQRQIAKTGFRFASPTGHWIGVAMVEIVLMAYFLMLFMPAPLPPIVVPTLFAATGAALYIAARNFAKRV